MQIPFIEEARELADDDHFALTRELEYMRENPRDFPASYRNGWIADTGWCLDKAAFFEASRDRYLEQARELFAENAA